MNNEQIIWGIGMSICGIIMFSILCFTATIAEAGYIYGGAIIMCSVLLTLFVVQLIPERPKNI